MTIVHIINPYSGSEQHLKHQELTFESIRRAKSYARGSVEVQVYAMYDREDEGLIPEFVDHKFRLERSALDCDPSLKGKRLPLLKDLIDPVVAHCNADYVVYSNIDIGLQLNFYKVVQELIQQGYDAFAINRRRVSGHYSEVSDLDQIYAEAGKMHNGYDCFVFRRELANQFDLGQVCLGIPFVDSVLFFNLVAFADHFKLFTGKHLTFHLGYELVKKWGSEAWVAFNKKEYLKVLKGLKDQLQLKNLPGSGLPFLKRHFKWLMNPTIHYPTVCRLDLSSKQSQRYIQSKKIKGNYYERLQKLIKLDY
ncbi:MAG: hypothetical protein KDD41_07310 [Flavobacteriales bacterium]|nr:hypothetical protein [Flavobacteriales bacterium]